jgi:hypothetical protein
LTELTVSKGYRRNELNLKWTLPVDY